MIYITQLIYIKDGQEATFNRFEEVAIPLIAKYNGRLLLRYRPTTDQIIAQTIETPYEIHLVEFSDEQDLAAFFQDEARKQMVHLKEQSIETVWLLKGTRLG
ncbi:hypothetical protein SAMN05421823_102771 [Catalinimonas alkaloidigena]|uniref:DUF1330 domain-containing protein n=1 Tax=Catalinimonas alkaloidigena TaxID=1075417 RepID=A0A1G9C1E7_9BACT|nr:DUF1330 domain-containing protein [Catalinimonas alkaloidigena]SDK45433.1 hypothetical protein SAMN05421823_102771 [Catalinimonas alkaloidigena]